MSKEEREGGMWVQSAIDLIAQAGFGSVRDFSIKNQHLSYFEMAKILSGQLSAAQIEMLICSDALANARNEEFQRHSLYRYLRQLVKPGWKYGSDPVPFSLAQALGGWSRMAPMTGDDPFAKVIERVKSREFVPEGWVPSSHEDPVLMDIFEGIKFEEGDHSLTASDEWDFSG